MYAFIGCTLSKVEALFRFSLLSVMSQPRLTTDHRRFNNSWYKPGGRIRRVCWYIIQELFVASGQPSGFARIFFLRLFGARIGKGVVLKPYVRIKYPWKLSIGDYSWIGERVWIDNLGIVRIGSNCCISQGAMILCGNHDFTKMSFDLMVGDIVLEDGVWIGARSVVCPGVHCESHSVLSVGSVASSRLEAYGIYRGNPAVKVKERVIHA